MKAKHSKLSGEALLNATIKENALMQIENLKTHPAVAVALAEGKIKLHAWVYEFETGNVFAFDETAEQFLPLGEDRSTPTTRRKGGRLTRN